MSNSTPDSDQPVSGEYASWGRVPASRPAEVVPLRWRSDLPPLDRDTSVLAYGRGRSYGDVCLNNGGTLLDTAGLDHVLAFDVERGVIRCEAGMTLAEVLALTVPCGWFLPVTPGTQYATVGGVVANDVHGKNHHADGTFGRFVTQMELVRSSGERLLLTPDGDHAGLFRATVAGLGLTGLITWVEFRLRPIQSDQINQVTTRFRSLEDFFAISEQAGARSPYVVSWIDALRPEGRGLLIEGDHAEAGSLPEASAAAEPRLAMPIDAPGWALNPVTVRAFNAAYFVTQRSEHSAARVHYRPFFYPLDAVGRWNRGYGRRGFYQYQFVVPFEAARTVVPDVLRRLKARGEVSFLSVLKTFGDVPSPGLLSFPRPGVTLALDLPNRGPETARHLRALDKLIRETGGAVYPAKDACMTGASFRAFYPEWETFAAHIDPAFSSSFWRRVAADV